MDAATDAQQRDALGEGRRIYLGNLLYTVTPSDIEEMLRQTGFDTLFEKLHIGVDPISGKNPGYCFLEFATPEEADRALSTLPGTLLFDRPVKVGPCRPKTTKQSRWGDSRSPSFNPAFRRWGDWKGTEADGEENPEQGEPGLSDQSSGNKARLLLGGLAALHQEEHETEMQHALAGFDHVAVGRRFNPHANSRPGSGNHHYCFVDFSSPDEAERALKGLHRKPVRGGTLRVWWPSRGPGSRRPATKNGWGSSQPDAPPESDSPARGGRQRGEDAQDAQERRRQQSERQRTIMASSNWRAGASAN